MSSPLVPDVGAQIRKAREAAGLTQVELARRLHQAERTIQAWEGNTRRPRLDALVTLAAVLNQPVSFFYGASDPQTEEVPA